jgi:hypothetical protein
VKRATFTALAVAFALLALPGAASAETVYTLDNAAPPLLAKFDTATPGDVTTIGPVSGLLGPPGSDLITAIDFRPSDGRLYAISNQNRVYTIDTSTGAATAVGLTPFTPSIPTSTIGLDFDPVRDELRLVTDGVGGGPVNLSISPTTGQATVDTPPNRAPGDTSVQRNPCFQSLAYTNNFQGATSTTLYGLGGCGSQLLRMGSDNGDPLPASSGRFSLVENLNPYVNLPATPRGGLDISPGGDAYALVQQSCCVYLYRVDLRPGAQTLYDPVFLGGQPTGPGTEWRDIAIAPAANDFSFGAPSYSVGETAGSATITVNRAGPAIGTASVAYSTSDGSATRPTDYTPVAGTLDFAAGQRSATFSVPINDDAQSEGPETVNVGLSGPHGGAATVTEPRTVPLTIDDNEPPPAGPAGPTGPLGPGDGLDVTAPTLALSKLGSPRLAAFLKGVKVTVTPSEPAALKLQLVATERGTKLAAATKEVVLASTALPVAGGARTATLKPSKRLVGKPATAFAVRLRVTATDAAGNKAVVTKAFSVKPNKRTRRKR